MSTPAPGQQDPRPRVRYGAHRSGRSVFGALMPSVLAVAAVASLITALAVWQGEEPGQSAGATTSAKASSSPSKSASPSTSTSPSTSPAVGTSSPVEPTETTSESSSETTSDMEVVVLNQTSRGGLAGTVADRLRDEGWQVPLVGNFRGVVPSTTVYYPGGARRDALAVAADLPTEPRVRPRFGNLSTSRLTVVVTDTYPS